MAEYAIPKIDLPNQIGENEAILIASGDLRLSANQMCWPAQEQMERGLMAAFEKEGIRVLRGHPFDPEEKHGFISSQRMGMDVFKNIHPDARLIVAEAVWQYSYHVLAGLRDHRGPILTIANWSGQWPGLVGLLNLNASLTKMGVSYSTIWSRDFTDDYFLQGVRQWIRTGRIVHDTSHARDLDLQQIPQAERALGRALAQKLQFEKAILGIFDEGCMGMYNAILEDELLNPIGVYKERLSQSALLAEMHSVSDAEAQNARAWLDAKGVRFHTGKDGALELTDDQILNQLKMYIAVVRMADRFGCDAIGIQYQQGLKDMVPASDLAEGLLNNVDRPPVCHLETRKELFAGRAIPHFNEADEGSGLDALVTNLIWSSLRLDPATTLHDIRWGEHYSGNGIDDFVWLFQISGAVPASHLEGGYRGASSDRQPPMYFPLGGGTLKGVCKPGEIVWSRVFIMGGQLHADLGRGRAVSLPADEINRRWQATTPEWPMMSAVLDGVTRDQMMARHKANHINVAYAPDPATANRALWAKAAMFNEMGILVHLCGRINSKED
ncbi:MAG: fucose isomerase [Chloroflexi bacterium]|nr:fucose isomerase [Chloroflexota bacterium]